jgi:hypothetical protein
MNCTLGDDSLQISNYFTEVTLRHHHSSKILDLMQAIDKGRTMIGPQELYPKKFVYLDSEDDSASSK